jgi:hypothetical protein
VTAAAAGQAVPGTAAAAAAAADADEEEEVLAQEFRGHQLKHHMTAAELQQHRGL